MTNICRLGELGVRENVWNPMLEKSFKGSEVEKCIHIALLRVQENATCRPTMSDVVVMLGSDNILKTSTRLIIPIFNMIWNIMCFSS